MNSSRTGSPSSHNAAAAAAQADAGGDCRPPSGTSPSLSSGELGRGASAGAGADGVQGTWASRQTLRQLIEALGPALGELEDLASAGGDNVYARCLGLPEALLAGAEGAGGEGEGTAGEGRAAPAGGSRTGSLADALRDLVRLVMLKGGGPARDLAPTAVVGRSVEDTRRLIRQHLELHGVFGVHGEASAPWEIIASPIGGRGVVATRDIQPGDLLFVDAPVVIGPRAATESVCSPVCVGCHRGAEPDALRACSRGCRLPVCTEEGRRCEDNPRHQAECALLLRWGVRGDPHQWAPDLLRAVTPIRCLGVSRAQREVLACMQSNHGKHHAFEVDLLMRLVGKGISPEEERFMRLACCVMDANAFRAAASLSPNDRAARRAGPRVGSLRGVYPLSALMNHECTPNTRHLQDARGHMVVRAARAVPKGQELTSTYSALLWGTPARRHHLLTTKHFLCRCARCRDPTEGGSFLSALPCPARPAGATAHCPGPVLAVDPLALSGSWQCRSCCLHVSADRAALLQSALGGMLGSLYADPAHPPSPQATLEFLEAHRHLLPDSNHIAVELKADAVWALGRTDGHTFMDLSSDQLQLKERLCRQLLSVLSALNAGQCSFSGMLLYELHCTQMEQLRRWPEQSPGLATEALSSVEAAYTILGEDASAPRDLLSALRRARILLGASAAEVGCGSEAFATSHLVGVHTATPKPSPAVLTTVTPATISTAAAAVVPGALETVSNVAA